MTINVAEALDTDTAIAISVSRSSGGAFNDGIYSAGSVSIVKMLASPQQPTPAQLQLINSGEREQDPITFITNKRLQTTDEEAGTVADTVPYLGSIYKVVSVQKWGQFGVWIGVAVKQVS